MEIKRPTSNTGEEALYTEYKLSINEFNKPDVDTGAKAIIDKVIELILMNPGTYPSRPYMGVGLVRNYRYGFTDTDLDELEQTTNDQINTYLPDFATIDVQYRPLSSNPKNLVIYITIDKSTYSLVLDTDKKTLDWLSGR